LYTDPEANVLNASRTPADKTYLAIHGCEIDLAASRIKGLKGWIQLKPKSMEVLEYLLNHPLKVCTREEILNAVWGR